MTTTTKIRIRRQGKFHLKSLHNGGGEIGFSQHIARENAQKNKFNDIPNKIKNNFDTSIKHLNNGKKNFKTPRLKKYAKNLSFEKKIPDGKFLQTLSAEQKQNRKKLRGVVQMQKHQPASTPLSDFYFLLEWED